MNLRESPEGVLGAEHLRWLKVIEMVAAQVGEGTWECPKCGFGCGTSTMYQRSHQLSWQPMELGQCSHLTGVETEVHTGCVACSQCTKERLVLRFF